MIFVGHRLSRSNVNLFPTCFKHKMYNAIAHLQHRGLQIMLDLGHKV